MSETTIQEFLDFYAPENVARSWKAPDWPPDAYALAAALLLESGGYLSPCQEWPPAHEKSPADWASRIVRLGRQWRDRYPGGEAPRVVSSWWKEIRAKGDLPVSQIGREQNREVCHSLLQICAAADEACHSVGAPMNPMPDLFSLNAEIKLLPNRILGSTLCDQIHPTKLRVLPKFHTPQTGMTLRSLSHHLALWTGSEVTPLWFTAPRLPRATETPRASLNLLLIPWPENVLPRQFVPADPVCGRLRNMSDAKFGFFTYRHQANPRKAKERLIAIYKAAQNYSGRIDGVILPELALSEKEFDVLRKWVTAQDSFLIAGISSEGKGDQPWSNRIGIEVPTEGHRVAAFQRKHHRWQLNRSQVVQYGLGGQLDPSVTWWEYAEAEERWLTFLSLEDWLSLCALLCEDLARQDPVARLVRAVGPNLVIALLMDGPQLASRWPARYATVLADDPGCSVLTLTSIGMCELSRPPGKGLSRTIALWKDTQSGEAIPIDLPPGADGILLNLFRRRDEEWTADGRSGSGCAGYPSLAGIHPVFATSTTKAASNTRERSAEGRKKPLPRESRVRVIPAPSEVDVP